MTMDQTGMDEIVGISPAMQKIRDYVSRLGSRDTTVLIIGETGVGKEVVAGALHKYNPKSRMFVTMNMGGVQENLMAAELFGHTKGAFTGAYNDRKGLIDTAEGGTLFLDEIGEMPPRMQGLLLRFLENGEIQRVGDDKVGKTVDTRVVAATNRDLRTEVKDGRFREDLFYRLNIVPIEIPPLRERREDIVPYISHFIRTNYAGRSPLRFERDAERALMDYNWPGNVREVRTAVDRAYVHCDEGVVAKNHIPKLLDEDLTTKVRSERTAGTTKPVALDDEVDIHGIYASLISGEGNFDTLVRDSFIDRDLSREDVRELVEMLLTDSRGFYRGALRRAGVTDKDYKRTKNFLTKYRLNLPFKDFRL